MAIISFVNHAKKAELFYPSHEGSTRDMEITIFRTKKATLKYDGRVPEHHQKDISISFLGSFGWSEIIIPGGRRWFDVAVLQHARRRAGKTDG